MEKFDILTGFLSLIGLLALYWALFGQSRYNKMIRGSEKEEPKEDTIKEVKK